MDRDDLHDLITCTRKLMITNLQEDVIENHYDNKYLSEEEYNQILSYESRENKIICFLDKLPAKPLKSYETFIKHLHEWYPWILTYYQVNYIMNRDENAAMIERALDEAEVPSLPIQHVSRKNELIKLIDYLHCLKRGEYVVVHGMGGCGKSTLVIEALRHSSSLVIDAFKRKIFWLMIGRESTIKKEAYQEAKVKELTIQQELYTKLFTPGGYHPPPLPLDNEEGKKKLKEKLNEPDFQDCLLILDDVPSSNFVECLNVGCKILVTTDNKQIMDSLKNQNKIEFIEVTQGFTEAESLQLFSKNLNSDALPGTARLIHSLCKGFPLSISLIASQLAEFREDVLKNKTRWKTLVEHLKNKDLEAAIGRTDRHRQEQIESLHKALKMSIDTLTPGLQKLYQDFALFMDDVNIKPEVLTILWNMGKKEAEDIMSEFEKKCLVIRTWNVQLLSYVYGVHDLLLDYLKRSLTEVERQDLHKKLITRYCEKFGDDFVNFPRNDNYIFLYLGYHLKEAGYKEKFPELYFRLDFIEVKILEHGAADVLYDLRKYKDYITNTEENIKKYEELYNFISRIGICRAISSTDIVQFALAECKESYVYKMGLELAKITGKKYFEYLTEVPKDSTSPDVHPIRGEKITAAIFTSDGNVVLANTDNVIKVINSKTHDTMVTFEGHAERITLLRLSCRKVFFLSASEGNEVKIWDLNNYGCGNGYSDKPRTPSPSLAQKAWKDNWPLQRVSSEKPIMVLSGHESPITDAQFSPRGLDVVTADRGGNVILWHFGLEKITAGYSLKLSGRTETDVNDYVISCCFTSEEKYLCVAATNRVYVYSVYGAHNPDLQVTPNVGPYIDSHCLFNLDFNIHSIAVVPSTTLSTIRVLLLGENFKAIHEVSCDEKCKSWEVTKTEQYSTLSRRRHDECICAAVSNDGRFLALVPTFYCIVVEEIATNKEVAKFHETNGKISGICWSYDNQSIMTTYESALFKIWHLPKETDAKVVMLKSSVFDAAWISDQESDDDEHNDELLVTAILDTEHNINIFHDLQPYRKISTQLPDSGDICQLCVCPVNGNVIYACKDGTVGLIVFEETKSYFVDRVPCNKIVKLKVFSDGVIIVVLLLVEKSPEKFTLVGWIKDRGSGDSNYLGTRIVYVDEGELILDFSADLKRKNAIYVTKTDHTFDVYDLRTAADKKIIFDGDDESDGGVTAAVETTDAKFVDFSPQFKFMASGNESGILITNLGDNIKRSLMFDNLKATVCKFNQEEKLLAVGFSSGLVRIYNIEENEKQIDLENKTSVFDLMWSQQDKILVILDNEIAIHDVTSQMRFANCITYISMVDKVLINDSFSQFVTVDKCGHFHVLKY